MTDSKYLGRAVSLLALLPMAVIGQRAQENVVPLKNWATPLYWQPSQTETAAPGTALPQLQFSANAVSTNALTFIAITPCRLVDTRGAAAGFNGMDPFAGPSIAAKATLTIPVQSPTEATADTAPAPCGVIPPIAQAYSFNLTVVPHAGGAVDYVTLWPEGSAQPFVATLNDPQGAIVANAAIVPAGPTGSPGYGGISVYNDGPSTTDVVIDMNGYFAAPTDMQNNTAIGEGTLSSNTSGGQNTAVGSLALDLNTTGSQNTATGYGALYNSTTGTQNTATGALALGTNTTGSYNTATGESALEVNTTGYDNTATGNNALQKNTVGYANTASGAGALADNTTGNYNTADGEQALQFNTTGNYNTATGGTALQLNTTGYGNTADGESALNSNTTGSSNTAMGQNALQYNSTTSNNTAVGFWTLRGNAIGSDNTAIGAYALQLSNGNYNMAGGYYALNANTGGTYNVGIGYGALQNNTTADNNIAIGPNAAYNVSGVNGNNIHIGSQGSSGDSGVIKIGNTQTSTYIAGISGTVVATGSAVFVNSSGQLGVTLSSRRFKEQIADMGDSSSNLLKLRPVTFFYKPEYDDGSHLLQYGLIAEEVAKVYPEMVVYGDDGQIMTVKYQMLAPCC